MIIKFEDAKLALALGEWSVSNGVKSEFSVDFMNSLRHDVLREIQEKLIAMSAPHNVITMLALEAERCGWFASEGA